MEEITNVNPETGEITVRPIEEITNEILAYKNVVAASAIEVGRRLIEAKAQLNHGEWQTWLKDKVDFSEASAQRFMRLANEWQNPSTLTVLGTSKALKLLALEPVEREQFIAEKHDVNGEEKTVEEMSNRELEKAIKERDKALADLKKAKADKDKLEKDLGEAEARRKSMIAEKEAEIEKIKESLDNSEAKEEIKELKDQINALQKKMTVSGNSDIAIFKLHFEQCQASIKSMTDIIDSMEGDEKDKLKNAYDALADMMKGSFR